MCGEEALKKEPHEERLIDQTKYRDAIVSGFRCCGIYPIDINEVLPRLPRVETYEEIGAVMVPMVSNGSVYEGDWQNDEIHGTAEVTCAMMFIILPLSLMMDGMDTVPMARKQCCGIRIQNEYGT